MMRRALAALALCGLAMPAHGAPAFPGYPTAPGSAAAGRWLASQTDLPLSSVVLVGPGYAFAFVDPDPPASADGLVWKNVREEATNMVVATRLNGRSATATLAFDCVRSQATASNVVIYAGNSLKGDEGRSTPAADWLTANPGLYLADLAKAACDPRFKRPFGGGARILTQAGGPGTVSVVNDPEWPSARPEPASPAPLRGVVAPQETGANHWVQVGAFAGERAAEQRWRAIQRLLPQQSAGRRLQTEPVGRGKTLVRALVGPFHGAAAGAFCTALKAHGGDCLVR
jgi:hypothetical protein